MIQDLNELYSWFDIKEAELSAQELDLLNNLRLAIDEIDTVFENILIQLSGEQVYEYYLVPYIYYQKIYPDFSGVLTDYYYEKLQEIYEKEFLPSLNLSFYFGLNQNDIKDLYDHFEIFYNLFFGRNRINIEQKIDYQILKNKYLSGDFDYILNTVKSFFEILNTNYEIMINHIEKTLKLISKLNDKKNNSKNVLTKIKELMSPFGIDESDVNSDVLFDLYNEISHKINLVDDWITSLNISNSSEAAPFFAQILGLTD